MSTARGAGGGAPQVSVLMPCYGDAALVERSLPRLLAGSSCRLEIVLLNSDVSQRERIRRLVASLGDARVRVLELGERAGFARAVNTGIEATTGPLVFLANSDLFVSERYLDELHVLFGRRRRAGCATGKILRYDLREQQETTVIDSTGLTIGRNRRVADRGENEPDVGQFEREEEVFGASGAALVVRRAALEDVAVNGRYLDESFSMYKEDVDLCWRLRLRGWECWYVPRAVAYHARTTRGLGGTPYRAAPRAFVANERRKPPEARLRSMRNQWLVLVKNEDLSNLARDLPHVLGREALVLAYNAFAEPRGTAAAIRSFFRALPGALAARRESEARRSVSALQLRPWFTRGS